MERHWDVIVVGAGLAGLAAAATAAGAGASVLVLDGQRPGGRATTDERAGYRLNRGAHAFYRGGAGPRRARSARRDRARGASPILDGARVRRGERVGALGLRPAGIVRSRMLTTAGQGAGSPASSLRAPPLEAGRAFRSLGRRMVRRVGARRRRPGVRRDVGPHAPPTWSTMAGVSADLVAAQMQLALRVRVEYLHGGWCDHGRWHRPGRQPAGRSSARGPGCARGADGRPWSGWRWPSDDAAGDGEGDDAGAMSDRGTLLARRVIVAAGTPRPARPCCPTSAAWQDLGPPPWRRASTSASTTSRT